MRPDRTRYADEHRVAFGGALEELEGIDVIDTETDAARALQDMYKALSRLNGTYFQTEDGTEGEGDEMEEEPIEGEEEIESDEEIVEEPEEGEGDEEEVSDEEDEEVEETPEDEDEDEEK